MKKKIKNIPFKLSVLVLFSMILLWGLSSRADDVSVDVSKSTVTTIIKDTDGDGVLDYEDPHPTVPEIYIVKDDNLNGIVDSFEFDQNE